MKKIIVVFLGILFLGGLGLLGLRKIKSQTKLSSSSTVKIHYHAGFIVFDNGKKLNFSDSKYMFIKPCTVDGKEIEVEGNEQIEKAHLHDNVGDLIHIEEKDSRWGDLFTNINFPIDYSKTTAFINGQEVPGFQSLPIKSDDSLVLFIGSVNKKLLSEAVTSQYLQEHGKKSGTCSD